MRKAISVFTVCLATTPLLYSQSPEPKSDALELLIRVAQHYSNAKTYEIELTEDRTFTRDFERQWSKSVLVSAEAPDNRSHFEGHTGEGNAIEVSDGRTVWIYHVTEHRYTAKAFTPADPAQHQVLPLSEIGLVRAKAIKSQFDSMVKRLSSAQFLPDEDLVIQDHVVHCKVVCIRNSDEKRIDPNYKFERCIWIDANRDQILKTTEHADTFILVGGGRLPSVQDSTVVYTHTILDGPVPNELFAFTPPSEAHLVTDFPDPRDGMQSAAGEPVPPIKFKTVAGAVTPIESFRGKPVLIDFWATWCAPCVASMPKLAELYEQGKDKGLIVISVDQDEDARKANAFLIKHGYSWPNFHDGDGAIASLMPSTGIPHVVLVDPNGVIAYDGTGMEEDRLRKNIAKLGPEFAALAPKPKTAPCGISAQAK